MVSRFAADTRASVRGYAPGTVEKRVAIARDYVAAVPKWRTATAVDVERWAAGHRWAPSTTRDAIGHVRAFYRWAIRHELVGHDPTVTVELPKVPRRLPRPARDVAIARAVERATPELAGMIALMAGAGLRCCEVARLRWADVDMVAGTIHVTGKGNRERVLAIGPAVRRALAAIDRPGAFVFVSPHTGRPYTAARVSQLVGRHLRDTGAGCTAHQLRHRFATVSLATCGELHTVRDLLGHASVVTTEVYAAVTGGDGADVSRRVTVPGL